MSDVNFRGANLTVSQALEMYRDMYIEFKPFLDQLKELETGIKNHCKATGELPDIDGARVKIHSRAHTQVHWDSKGLQGYAISNPEVNHFRRNVEKGVALKIEVDK